jgi:hypothetical protein
MEIWLGILTEIRWVSRQMEGLVDGGTNVQADILFGKQKDRQA